ncbi:hypothetical protein J4468_04380 [Candidatus Woesearchaeota archaeon]|nr:hypothetical protein [Candidatus Woesearchaeota archaeon]
MQQLRLKNLRETKEKISKSVNWEVLIIDSVSRIDILEESKKKLDIILQRWTSYFFPEHLGLSPKELLKKKPKSEMGAELKSDDISRIKDYIKQRDLTSMIIKKEHSYLKKVLEKETHHLIKVTSPYLVAKLIDYAGNLERLAMSTSSKIQVFGAEKSLFRHLTQGTASPRFGILFLDDSIRTSKDPGKAARALASKIMIASRQDFFKKKD